MGRPRERRHVAKRAVDLERVHTSEIGRDVSQSIWMLASNSRKHGIVTPKASSNFSSMRMLPLSGRLV